MKPVSCMIPVAAAALLAAATAGGAEAAAPPTPQYVGVAGCATCHKRKSTGDQFGQWQASLHAKAYETLATDKAKEYGKAKGIADPQKAQECLQCHVTGYPVDEKQIAEVRAGKKGYQIEDGVSCEACHGPGSFYKSRKVMKNREAAVAAGLVIPDEAVCVTCHNEKSPNFKGFDFDTYVAKITHPNPKKAAKAAE